MSYPFSLSPLPWDTNALLPFLSMQNIRVHYDILHKGYVDKLNRLTQQYPGLQNISLEQIVQGYAGDAYNFAAQILNHNFFWRSISPSGGGLPSDRTYSLIIQTFGSFDNFKEKFIRAAMQHFGSGYVWLLHDPTSKMLVIETGKDAWNPISSGQTALLNLDLWEHSYYLDYINDKERYTREFFNFINWANVEDTVDRFVYNGFIRSPIY